MKWNNKQHGLWNNRSFTKRARRQFLFVLHSHQSWQMAPSRRSRAWADRYNVSDNITSISVIFLSYHAGKSVALDHSNRRPQVKRIRCRPVWNEGCRLRATSFPQMGRRYRRRYERSSYFIGWGVMLHCASTVASLGNLKTFF